MTPESRKELKQYDDVGDDWRRRQLTQICSYRTEDSDLDF